MSYGYMLRLVCFDVDSPSMSVGQLLVRLGSTAMLLESLSENLSLDKWMLAGNTLEEAKRHRVFDESGISSMAVDFLEKAKAGNSAVQGLQIWNGRSDAEGASIQYLGIVPSSRVILTIAAKGVAFSKDWEVMARTMAKVVARWKPKYATLYDVGYENKKVFKDRPGVGWMLYLDKVLTIQDVMEARALVPVMDGEEQIGTIVVSETDGLFSDGNPEHVKVANDIEIRLVDHDLLPLL